MKISETQKGDLTILAEAVIWSLFPIVTILSYSSFNPLTTLAWSTFFTSIFFAGVMFARDKFKQLKKGRIYKYVIAITFFLGWLYYGLYVTGLKYTSAGNASIIALMELFFSYLFFNVYKKQTFSNNSTWGAILMLFGACIILMPKNGLSLHGGDFMVLAATACAPLGNYYQQKLRKLVSSETILFLRSLFTFPLFFLLAYLFKAQTSLAVAEKSFGFLLLNGFIILGFSKYLWMEGIHRISVTRANALSTVAPLSTLLFAWMLFHQAPSVWQLGALVPLALGLALLTKKDSPALEAQAA